MRISDWSSDVCSSDLGVDFAGEIAPYELIHGIRERLGCGILMISHDLHIVMGKTDTVVCLNGHVCCPGTPQAVTESPEYRALFGSEAAAARSEERRVGQECVSTGRSRWSPTH